MVLVDIINPLSTVLSTTVNKSKQYFLGGRHSTVVALALCTQPSRVQIWLLEKSNQEEKMPFQKTCCPKKLFGVSALGKKKNLSNRKRNILGNAEKWTRVCCVRSKYATSVLCSPPQKMNFMSEWACFRWASYIFLWANKLESPGLRKKLDSNPRPLRK